MSSPDSPPCLCSPLHIPPELPSLRYFSHHVPPFHKSSSGLRNKVQTQLGIQGSLYSASSPRSSFTPHSSLTLANLGNTPHSPTPSLLPTGTHCSYCAHFFPCPAKPVRPPTSLHLINSICPLRAGTSFILKLAVCTVSDGRGSFQLRQPCVQISLLHKQPYRTSRLLNFLEHKIGESLVVEKNN